MHSDRLSVSVLTPAVRMGMKNGTQDEFYTSYCILALSCSYFLVTEKKRLKTNNANTQYNDNTFEFTDKNN